MDMSSMEAKGSISRIRKCIRHLLTFGDQIDGESWEFVAEDLRLRSTFLFCDFNRFIAASPEDQKQPLTELANKLFHCMEEMDEAVKCRSVELARACYNDATSVLQDILISLIS
ncbi:Photosynthetic NDH subunit of lumenal location 3 [Nymphaea thermarum]|nr:Photosynthetic NDH subunit of lumenal location 3 [Nymphaea thermarum]